MCKKLKDILHLFNIKGNDRRSFGILASNIPDTTEGSNIYKYVNVTWAGERLILRYGGIKNSRINPNSTTPVAFTHNWTNGYTEQVKVPKYERGWIFRIDEVFFDCTNVTSLIVNGDVLI